VALQIVRVDVSGVDGPGAIRHFCLLPPLWKSGLAENLGRGRRGSLALSAMADIAPASVGAPLAGFESSIRVPRSPGALSEKWFTLNFHVA
jgi:hypothetical protein